MFLKIMRANLGLSLSPPIKIVIIQQFFKKKKKKKNKKPKIKGTGESNNGNKDSGRLKMIG